MIYIYIFICLTISIIAIKTEKILFNPVTIFCGLWGTILLLSSFSLWKLYEVDGRIYNILFIGVIFFVLGYYLIKLLFGEKIIVRRKKYKSLCSKNYIINYKIVYFFALFSLPFYIKDFIYIKNIAGFGADLGSIQDLIQEGKNIIPRSSIENALRLLIVTPFVSWMSVPILVSEFWFGKKDKKLSFILFSLIILRVLSTGGRLTIIQLIFCFICLYLFNKNKNKKHLSIDIKKIINKNKKKFILLTILLIALLGGITYSRASSAALRTIYYNFAMPPLMFDAWSKVVDQNNIFGMGMASLNGFLFPINYILRSIFNISLPDLYNNIFDLISLTDSNWQWIGHGIKANAYVSIFWFFYVDFRIFGVIIGSFIYGVYCRISYNKAYIKLDIKNITIYSLILLGVFYSFGRFQFSQHTYVLALIYLNTFIFKKIKMVV